MPTDNRHSGDDLGTRLDAAKAELHRLQLERNRLTLDDRDPLTLLRKAAGVSWWHAREWLGARVRTVLRPRSGTATDATVPTPYLVRQRHSAVPARPRVLHLLANFVRGGSARLVVDLIEQLGHRFDQAVVTALLPAPPHYDGIAVAERPVFGSVDEALTMVRAHRPDLVHVHYFANPDSPYDVHDLRWYQQIFGALERLAGDQGCRVVQNVNLPVVPFISSSVTCYVYVSDYVREKFGLYTAPGLTIYPGSDLEHFRPEDSVDAVPDDTLGMIYRLERDKLDERAIDPFIRAVTMRPGTKALIVGGGHYLAPYRAAVRRAGLSDAFTFTGYVSYDALPAYIRQMSVFVAPVHAESFGQVSPFAMGAARPVAGYAVGALAEITGDASLLALPGDAEGLARVLVDLLDDRERRLRLGAGNRRRALERFSVEAMAQAYESLYDRLLGPNETFE